MQSTGNFDTGEMLKRLGKSLGFAIALLIFTAAVSDARPYRLQWDANTDGVTQGYLVYVGSATGSYGIINGTDAGNETEFQVNLVPGSTYYFQVRAYDAAGTPGPPSTELSFLVPNTAPVLTNPGSLLNAPGIFVSRQLVATDADNDGLMFTSVTGLPPGLSASASGLITGTIGGGVTTYTVTATVSDGYAQDVETFTWGVSTSSTLAIGNVTINEGNSGTSVATFTVTLSPVNALQTVTVNYATANGTATAADYTAGSGTLTFAPLATTRTISVIITGDTAVESNETFVVNLSGATNAAIGDAQGVGTISNDDASGQSTLTIGDVAITEGNAGTSLATFTVTLSPVNASQSVTVNYATANGTASSSSNDYESASGTLTFSPSTATRTLNVIINGDTSVEPNQTFFVNLSGATNATIADAQAVGTITNDDVGASGPTVNVVSTSVAPGGQIDFTVSGGSGSRMDWVTLTPASAPNSSYLDWKYLNGTKTAPAVAMTSATLQFTAPSTPGTYNIRFFANNSLANRLATSASITVATQPTLTIGNVTVSEGNSGTRMATFTVTLTPVNTSQTVSVNYATADGTATTANNDYEAANGTLSFSASTATRTFSVTINGDTTVEPNETFVANLSGATNAVIGDAQATATITNDEGAAAGATVNMVSTSVAPGGQIQFTVAGGPANRTDWVTLSRVSAADNGYLDWNYLNGTKTAPTFGQSGATLQFTAPWAPGTYNVRFFANNSLANKLAVSATITVASQPSQPSQPTLTIGDVTVTEGNSGMSVATFTVTLAPANASESVTVNYATANATATTANNDYEADSGTLTFAPSATTQTISVAVNGDTVPEANETFVVNLSGATDAAIGDAQATGIITNDEGVTVPSVNVVSTTVQSGAPIQFMVSGGPAYSMDWVALTPASAADNSYVAWQYLNGQITAPVTGVSAATLQFTAPAPGIYNIRFYADNRLANKITTSVTITVTP